jgi:hypothetical protein
MAAEHACARGGDRLATGEARRPVRAAQTTNAGRGEICHLWALGISGESRQGDGAGGGLMVGSVVELTKNFRCGRLARRT